MEMCLQYLMIQGNKRKAEQLKQKLDRSPLTRKRRLQEEYRRRRELNGNNSR